MQPAAPPSIFPRSQRHGLTLLEMLVAISVAAVLLSILIPALNNSRESARRITCASNLRQLAVATQMVLTTKTRYPTLRRTAAGDSDRLSNLSIHAELLTYLDQQALHGRLDLNGSTTNEPPASGTNGFALQVSVPVFACPSDSVPVGGNSYRACYGTTPGLHTTWAPGRPRRGSMEAEALAGVFLGGATAASLRDGASQTALFSERVVGDGDPSQHHPIRDPVRSTEHNFWPNDSVVHCAAVSSAQPHLSYTGWTWLSNDYSQTAYNHCLTPNSLIPDCFDGWNEIRVGQGAMTARSWHAAGVSVAFADGAVKFINEAIDLKIWRGLGSISGQELIDEF